MRRFAKRRSRVSAISTDLKPFLRKIARQMRDVHPEIWAGWAGIVGAQLSSRTMPKHLRKGVLTIAVANSTWMQELSFITVTLIDRFAEEVGPGVVREIRLVLDSSLVSRRTPPGPQKTPVQAANIPDVETAVKNIKDKQLQEAIISAVAKSKKSGIIV